MIVGLKAGLVSALIDVGVEAEGMDTALNLDEAFRLLELSRIPAAEADKPAPAPSESETDDGKSDSDRHPD